MLPIKRHLVPVLLVSLVASFSGLAVAQDVLIGTHFLKDIPGKTHALASEIAKPRTAQGAFFQFPVGHSTGTFT